MLYKHGHVPDRFSQPLGSLPSTSRRYVHFKRWAHSQVSVGRNLLEDMSAQYVKRIGTAHSRSEARGMANMELRAIHDIHNTLSTTRRCIASVAILFLNIVSPSIFHPPTSGYWVPECWRRTRRTAGAKRARRRQIICALSTAKVSCISPLIL